MRKRIKAPLIVGMTILTIMWVNSAHAVSGQYTCTIKGIYTVKDGLLKQRPGKKGLGERVFVNKETSEVTGYFGTDGAKIVKVKRPAGVLSLEMEYGIIGDAANILEVEGSKKTPTGPLNFYYKKNWLHITGVCE